MDKRVGAVPMEFPKTIWIRMLKQPNIEELKMINIAFTLRGKFNVILEERLLDGDSENHHIMSIVVDDEKFHNTGEPSDPGKAQFWNEVSKAIQKFDLGKITLNPRNASNNAAQASKFVKDVKSHHDASDLRFKLPTPTPTGSRK